MKILKILFILLVPALGIVGCQKSDIKPDCPNHSESSSKTTNTDESAGSTVGARSANVSFEDEEGTSVVGSGDDDRDGGDKKKKTK
jgi:hypothetical protein